MKILVISNLYPPYYLGGYELMCKIMTEALIKRGHEIFVLTSKWGLEHSRVDENIIRELSLDPAAFLSEEHKTITIPFSGHRFNQLKGAFISRSNYTITRKWITKINPDLVYFWNLGSIGITPVIAAQKQGIPTVFSICDYWLADYKKQLSLESNWIKKRFRLFIKGCKDFGRLEMKHIIVISQVLKNSHIAHGFSSLDIKVVPWGIPRSQVIDEIEIKDASRCSDQHKNLLYVGRICPEKGPDIAINAIKYLIFELGINNIKLDLIGDGPKEYLEELKFLVKSLNLENHVTFLGKMDHEQVMEAYQNYDIFLFPSIWEEPFGATYLEAMARGVVVIVSDRGAPREVITDGVNGLIVPGEDHRALALAINKILKDQNLSMKLRIEALKTICSHYLLDHIIDLTEELLIEWRKK